jgi:hypothetical protein
MSEENKVGLSKEALLSKIHESYSRLIDFLVGLDSAQLLESMEEGGWTIKDILAHVTAWEDVLIRFYIQGEPIHRMLEIEDAQYWVMSEDEQNERLYQRTRDWTANKVLEHARETHEALMRILEDLAEDRLRLPPPHLKGEPQSTRPLFDFIVGNTYDHYEEHLATVRQIAAQSKD